ncbi:putative manganese transporter [Oceanicella sp. SM1341]|uniref:putative manganese transporter n=1 Tax=Oceanicella sp. SM1341 TaxID=1548889 RepID=UPI000E4A6CDA|nr:putative manganese transporter [Oceanicella sp. SM1341]
MPSQSGTAGRPPRSALATGPGPFRPGRLALVALLGLLAVLPGEIGVVTRGALTDAYLQVSVFVAATLLLFYGVERAWHVDVGSLMRRHRRFQVPIAALFGALPGCGGAIVVVAAYSSGHVGMGAVTATLTATMGDAAFLLIATRPDVAAVVLPLSFATGILSGYAVDWLAPGRLATAAAPACVPARIARPRARDFASLALAAPGLVFGAMLLADTDPAETFGALPQWVALAGIALGALIWAASPVDAITSPQDPPLARMSEETSFVTAYVIMAYLAYEYLITLTGIDLGQLFDTVAPLLPLIAIAVGLIPGCGPQVLVTTLFLNGLIPFSALIGNAISNDGDALFPALALDPGAAVRATLYSTIPALLVAYGVYFLAPGLF